jgi:hypothetical protein
LDINTDNRTVTLTIPQGTALTGLSPVIGQNGAGISPASGTAQNFFATAEGFTPVTYIVTAGDGSKAEWLVTVTWEPLTATAGIAGYFSSPPANAGTGADDNLMILPVGIELTQANWEALLTAIGTSKFVALDLSACTASAATSGAGLYSSGVSRVFDPRVASSFNANKEKIVSLILPNAATGTQGGDISSKPFVSYTNLKNVTGAAVETIGAYGFAESFKLTSVNFPAAKTIDNHAFSSCTTLPSVNFPAAASIGQLAFQVCNALASAKLPAAASIGMNAFGYATGTALTVTLGTAPPTLEMNMFSNVTVSKNVTVKVPSGAAAAYTDTWQDAFKGKGGDGTGTLNTNITLTIQTYTP